MSWVTLIDDRAELHPLEQRVLLRQLFERAGLTERERDVVLARGCYDVKQSALAKEINRTPTIVSKAEWRALRKLRHVLMHETDNTAAWCVWASKRQLEQREQNLIARKQAELIKHWDKNYRRQFSRHRQDDPATGVTKIVAERRWELQSTYELEREREEQRQRTYRRWRPPPLLLICVDCGATANAHLPQEQIGWTCDHDDVTNHCRNCNTLKALASVRVSDMFPIRKVFRELPP